MEVFYLFVKRINFYWNLLLVMWFIKDFADLSITQNLEGKAIMFLYGWILPWICLFPVYLFYKLLVSYVSYRILKYKRFHGIDLPYTNNYLTKYDKEPRVTYDKNERDRKREQQIEERRSDIIFEQMQYCMYYEDLQQAREQEEKELKQSLNGVEKEEKVKKQKNASYYTSISKQEKVGKKQKKTKLKQTSSNNELEETEKPEQSADNFNIQENVQTLGQQSFGSVEPITNEQKKSSSTNMKENEKTLEQCYSNIRLRMQGTNGNPEKTISNVTSEVLYKLNMSPTRQGTSLQQNTEEQTQFISSIEMQENEEKQKQFNNVKKRKTKKLGKSICNVDIQDGTSGPENIEKQQQFSNIVKRQEAKKQEHPTGNEKKQEQPNGKWQEEDEDFELLYGSDEEDKCKKLKQSDKIYTYWQVDFEKALQESKMDAFTNYKSSKPEEPTCTTM